MSSAKPAHAAIHPKRLGRLAFASALGMGLFVTSLWPHGASAQATESCAKCSGLLNTCDTLLSSAQETRAEQAATISNLQNQIAQLKEGKGFHGLSDYQALNIAASAISRLEEPPPPDASAEELADKTARLQALQLRTTKLKETSARAAQQKAANAR